MYAILMKKKINNQGIETIEPHGLLKGDLKENGVFYSKGIKYEPITLSKNEGFGFPIDEQELKECIFPSASDFDAFDCSEISKLYFYTVKLFKYIEFDGEYYATHKDVISIEKADFSKPFYYEEEVLEIEIPAEELKELYMDIMSNKQNITKEEDSPKFDIRKTYNYVISSLIGQTEQIKQILALIAKNQIITNPRLKSNILIYGPTGVGKTEVFRLISESAGIPIVIEDITGYTKSGYVGHDVEEIVYKLLSQCNFDVKKASKGIIIIDEIDKKASTDSRDAVTSTDVLYSLLKLVEGTTLRFKGKNGEVTSIDTSLITFVFCGNFESVRIKNNNVTAIGFEKNRGIADDTITTGQFQKCGLPLELLRRIHAEIKFDNLTLENLIEILYNSKNSVLSLYREMFKNAGVSLQYTEKVIETIAKEAHKHNLGASSLNRVVEDILNDAMFNIFYSESHYSELVIDEKTVTDNKRYKLI